MKKALLLLHLFISIGVFAQERPFRFEAGVNTPLVGHKGFKIGYYVEGIYNIANKPLFIDLKVVALTINNNKTKFDVKTWSVIPSINYNFYEKKTIKAYIGIGAGISADKIETGDIDDFSPYPFNFKGNKLHFAAVPQLGVMFFNHINFSVQYYITYKDYSRLLVSLGYRF